MGGPSICAMGGEGGRSIGEGVWLRDKRCGLGARVELERGDRRGSYGIYFFSCHGNNLN